MQVIFSKKKEEKVCRDFSKAQKEYGKSVAMGIMSRINALESAKTLKDIIVMPNFRFHALNGEEKGLFAIDVRNKKDPWRIILEPLDEKEQRFIPCNIDEIVLKVKIIMIVEVSKHYE